MPSEPSNDLIQQAVTAIVRAWEDGRDKYPGDPWRDLSAQEHLTHAADHAETALWDCAESSVDLTDIDHGIFRLAAARWKIEQERKNAQ